MKSVTSMCCLTWAYFFGTLSRAEHTIIQSPNQGNAFWLWKRWRREVCARGSYFSSTRHWCCRSLSMVLVSWPWLILIWSALTQFINEAMMIILGLTIYTLSAVMRCGTTSTCRIWRKGTKWHKFRFSCVCDLMRLILCTNILGVWLHLGWREVLGECQVHDPQRRFTKVVSNLRRNCRRNKAPVCEA